MRGQTQSADPSGTPKTKHGRISQDSSPNKQSKKDQKLKQAELDREWCEKFGFPVPLDEETRTYLKRMR